MYSQLDMDAPMPVPVGFGDLTPQQLVISAEASPFYEPPAEPEPETTVDTDLETIEPSAFEAEPQSATEEIVSRATAFFENSLRFALDNPKIMGMLLIVGVSSYYFGKRKLR